MRELDTAESVAEVMSWRIDAITAASPSDPQPVQDAPVLPWLAAPPVDRSEESRLPKYLSEATEAIGARVAEVADLAARERPGRINMLGVAPSNEHAREQWMAQITVVAAYRDQHRITTDDPRQVLGPYPEPGHPGYKAYWNAASSVLAARQLAGLDHLAPGHRSVDPATARGAVDVYRSLPEPERAEIAQAVAAKAGVLWFGDHSGPDEEAAVQHAYAEHLVDELAARKYISTNAPAHVRSRVPKQEPREATLAKHGRRSSNSRSSAHDCAVQPDVARCQQDQPQYAPSLDPLRRPFGPVPGR